MMSKTHLSVGMATSLALTMALRIPGFNTPSGIAVALAGGALGGILPDVDVLKTDNTHDGIIGEGIAILIIAAVIGMDYLFRWGIIDFITKYAVISIIGLIALAILWLIGYTKDHRAFTHSILAMLLFSAATFLVYPMLGVSCLFGYLSHLFLDILNKKGIQLFFPFKSRFCLKLCYANKTANKLFMILGFIATLLLLIYRIMSLPR